MEETRKEVGEIIDRLAVIYYEEDVNSPDILREIERLGARLKEAKMIQVKRVDEISDRIGEFINREFTVFGQENGVELNYDEFCYVAEDDAGQLLGVITGRAYYNEVHIGDLIIGKDHRRSGIGRKLVEEVEKAYKGKGYEKITLTTFGFQAPEFYKKLGYGIEFVRVDKEPKLNKYFLAKPL